MPHAPVHMLWASLLGLFFLAACTTTPHTFRGIPLADPFAQDAAQVLHDVEAVVSHTTAFMTTSWQEERIPLEVLESYATRVEQAYQPAWQSAMRALATYSRHKAPTQTDRYQVVHALSGLLEAWQHLYYYALQEAH